ISNISNISNTSNINDSYTPQNCDYSLFSLENPLFGPDKLSFINKSGHYTHLERLPEFFKAINVYYKSLAPKSDTSKSPPLHSSAKDVVNKSIKPIAEFLYNNLCSIYEWDQQTTKTTSNTIIRLINSCFFEKGFMIGLLELGELNVGDLTNVVEDIKALDDHMSGIEFLDMDYLKTFIQICRKFVPEVQLFETKDDDESESDSESDSGDENEQAENEESSEHASASMSEGEEELLMMKLQYMFPDENY
ncbi:hypothetical protein RFI_05588, partial [Reticulomyxa filosa]